LLLKRQLELTWIQQKQTRAYKAVCSALFRDFCGSATSGLDARHRHCHTLTLACIAVLALF
jgi:hypothetical protein